VAAGIIDSTVIIHLLRGYQPAIHWVGINQTLAMTSITWLEVMAGVPNKRAQVDTLKLLNSFALFHLTIDDQEWTMQQIERLRFKHSPGINDSLIASVSYRMQLPLYTHNLKHMTPLIGNLAIVPYH
jgi:predicted nucleic acid-binding protein